MLLPSGNPFKCHEEVLYLQSMIPSKRFDIFLPDRGMLRRSRCVQIFLETSLTRQCLERRVLICLQTLDCVLFQEKSERLLSIPQSGGINVKLFIRLDHRLRIKTLFMAFKRVPDGGNIESTV